MTPEAAAQLKALVARYIWWETPDEAMRRPERLLAQIMDKGDFQDLVRLQSLLGPGPFLEAINHAEPGWFGPRAWHYWHYRLGLTPIGGVVPEQPKRAFLALPGRMGYRSQA